MCLRREIHGPGCRRWCAARMHPCSPPHSLLLPTEAGNYAVLTLISWNLVEWAERFQNANKLPCAWEVAETRFPPTIWEKDYIEGTQIQAGEVLAAESEDTEGWFVDWIMFSSSKMFLGTQLEPKCAYVTTAGSCWDSPSCAKKKKFSFLVYSSLWLFIWRTRPWPQWWLRRK